MVQPPLDPQAYATTLEVQYLRPMLASLPPMWRTAVDVGAHRGDVTDYLAGLGLRVLAVEPNPAMAHRLEQRFAGLIAHNLVRVERCAASDRSGEQRDLFVGSASTVCTLEEEWTTRGFPEEFTRRTAVRVPLARVDELVRHLTMKRLGFLKVDVEGHEQAVLRGCFSGAAMPAPTAVMFEAFSRFPEAAEDCLKYLARQGYNTFDIFVRVGRDLCEVQRFIRPELPGSWLRREGTLFYANVIAYHPAAAGAVTLPDPAAFFRAYVRGGRHALRAA